MLNKQQIKLDLFRQLVEARAFWSYDPKSVTLENTTDEMLICKVLVHLDVEEINKLFLIYPKKQIKTVWRDRLCIQPSYYYRLNKFLACAYFGIKDTTRYIERAANEHFKRLNLRSDEWFNRAYGGDI
jgi:hypothetical protein